jgi:preprotein translocase subunit SecG
LSLLSIFMILVILVQRGRGGGLTGALGGMGGQSAFGTKAGDLFTRVTIVVAAIWVLLSMAALKVLNPNNVSGYDERLRGQTPSASKTAEGGLLPITTKTSDATDGKSGAATPEAPTPNDNAAKTPATTPPASTETPVAARASDAKPADAKP